METFEAAGYVVEYDRDATAAAYGRVPQGGADVCTCDSCGNFARLRVEAYPGWFIELLGSLGIDPLKEDEAYECGKDDSGLYLYGGWFHFIGRVVQAGEEVDVDGFRYWFDEPGHVPEAHEAFGSGPVSAIEFMVRLPWVSEKPEPYDAPTEPPSFWRRVRKKLGFLR